MPGSLYRLLVVVFAPASCVTATAPVGVPGVDTDGAGEAEDAGATGGEGEVDAMTDPEREPGDGRFGVVVVDVQEAFVAGAVDDDLDGIIDRTGQLFALAERHGLPFFITFEAATTGDHALAAALRPLVPEHAMQFVKTTFDATGLPAFADALDASGLSRFVVVGSETDVCVLETVLGMRRLGYTVVLEEDAVFSSEPNTGPALRRMTQAGVVLADSAQVTAFAERRAALPDAAARTVPRVTPGAVAIVLNHLDDAVVAGSSDRWKAQKLARLRELLLISEWFDVPLYAQGPDAPELPAELEGLIERAILPASRLDDGVTQLVVAGTDAGLDDLAGAQPGARTLFLMEDALVAASEPGDLRQVLEARYDSGDVPLTYKTFYYEMTATVAFEDWPADWIELDAEYYERTVAPEDLPPIDP
ncbi:MAG: isochorismatase family protein [Deltaproteobacteria bacterium]|nr:isochorismatase family protein [Deltaproteobacteria bacterium]